MLAVVLTLLARRLASGWRFVDRPAGHKQHSQPVPLLGGVALYLAVAVSLLACAPGLEPTRSRGVLIAAALVATAGLSNSA